MQLRCRLDLDQIESPLKKYHAAKRKRALICSSGLPHVTDDGGVEEELGSRVFNQTMASDFDRPDGAEGRVGSVNESFRATLQQEYASPAERVPVIVVTSAEGK